MKNTILKTTMALALSTALFTGCGGGSSEGGAGTGTQGNGTQNPSTNTQNNGGILTYKNLQWQDNGVESSLVTYAYRNDYCEGLTLGGHSGWRLPTLGEYKEVYVVKDKFDFAWSNENYIFWTASEYTIAGKERISVFNMSNGLSPLFYVDRIGSNDKWGERCVRNVK